MDLRNTLRYLGVPIRKKSYMFGDNQSVVNSSMQVQAKLHKRHSMLSFHRVREAIASGMLIFHFIPGAINPADILSKHWGYSQVWHRLKTLLFWHGDTADIPDEDDITSNKRGVTKSKQERKYQQEISGDFVVVTSSTCPSSIQRTQQVGLNSLKGTDSQQPVNIHKTQGFYSSNQDQLQTIC